MSSWNGSRGQHRLLCCAPRIAQAWTVGGRMVRHSSDGSDPIAPPYVMSYYEAWNLTSATMDLVSRASKRAPSQVFHSVAHRSFTRARVSTMPFGAPD